jgi:hypothetical protein
MAFSLNPMIDQRRDFYSRLDSSWVGSLFISHATTALTQFLPQRDALCRLDARLGVYKDNRPPGVLGISIFLPHQISYQKSDTLFTVHQNMTGLDFTAFQGLV